MVEENNEIDDIVDDNNLMSMQRVSGNAFTNLVSKDNIRESGL